jgi:hypothetical protein
MGAVAVGLEGLSLLMERNAILDGLYLYHFLAHLLHQYETTAGTGQHQSLVARRSPSVAALSCDKYPGR